MTDSKRQLVWFKTNDLRVKDHSALYHGAAAGPVIAVFVVTPEQYKEHNDAPIKQNFWYRNLLKLSNELEALNIPLKILQCESYAEIPEELFKFSILHNITEIHFNKQYEFNEQECDSAVSKRFSKNAIQVNAYSDTLFFEPGTLLTGKGTYYTVFTAFKNLFNKRIEDLAWRVLPKPKKQIPIELVSDTIFSWCADDDIRSDLWPAGESAAKRRLNSFVKNRILHYKNTRDIPAINGTSTISPYLTAGVLSARQCFSAIRSLGPEQQSIGVQTWRNELIWREFYKHILVGFPHVSQHKAFKQKTEAINWNQNEKHFIAWCEGKTGVPIVDAAMRQLVQTGWMHNRLRMVTAMFLSKNLFLDWRKGEKFFMQHLIDGDLSANNGGWQWSASTGTDAAPYFRIFNPVTQSQRFDGDGKFIRKFVPELKQCDNKSIHDPWNSKTRPVNLDYPKPIVDLKKTRMYAIDKFKQLG